MKQGGSVYALMHSDRTEAKCTRFMRIDKRFSLSRMVGKAGFQAKKKPPPVRRHYPTLKKRSWLDLTHSRHVCAAWDLPHQDMELGEGNRAACAGRGRSPFPGGRVWVA